MSRLLQKICGFVRCRERASILVLVVFAVGIVFSFRITNLLAFTGYYLRYPVNNDSEVDLSLHYVNFGSTYSNIYLGSGTITYTEVNGGRSSSLNAGDTYVYNQSSDSLLAVRADYASPKLTARSTYNVVIPSGFVYNSGDYWEGFNDWYIKVPDGFGDATYLPQSTGSTLSPQELVGPVTGVYFPNASGGLSTDGNYPPSADLRWCSGSQNITDISQYLLFEYDTIVNDTSVLVASLDQSFIDTYMNDGYGEVMDGQLTRCLNITYKEGAIILDSKTGSYANGPTYNIRFLKPERLVGAGTVIATTNPILEFDFNQSITLSSSGDKYVRLFNGSNELVETKLVDSFAGGNGVSIGDSSNDSDTGQTNDALYVDFSIELSHGTEYYVTLDQGAVLTTAHSDYMRADMENDDYRFTISYDTNAPTVTSRTPAYSATNVATSTQTISLNFDEPISFGTAATYELSDGSGNPNTQVVESYAGEFESIAGSVLTIDVRALVNQAFSTTTGLAAGTTYTVIVPENLIQDDVGTNMPTPASFLFTTVSNPVPPYDSDEPVVVSKVPAFGAVNIATSTQDLTLTFDEPIYASTSVQTFRISNGVATSTVVANSVGQYDSVLGSVLTIEIDELVNQAFSTTTGLAAETTYTVQIPRHIVRDDVSLYMSAPAYFVFTTVDNYEEPTPEPEPEPEPEEEADNGRPPSSRRRANVGTSGGSGVGGSAPGFGNNVVTHEDIGPISTFRDLFFGATGSDVLELQRALNRIGFTVNETGAGSPGQETEYYGTSTQAAVTRFQMNFGIAPNLGYFGPVTRALLGFILGR